MNRINKQMLISETWLSSDFSKGLGGGEQLYKILRKLHEFQFAIILVFHLTLGQGKE